MLTTTHQRTTYARLLKAGDRFRYADRICTVSEDAHAARGRATVKVVGRSRPVTFGFYDRVPLL